jgi:carboxymethylenebutenolidase
MAAEPVRIPRQPNDIGGVLAVPAVDGRFPAAIVIPTIRGLDEFVTDVAERLAGEGFVALGVDIFDHPGVPEDIFKRPGAQPDDEILGDLEAAFAMLQKDPRVIPEAICAWGYCIGGRFSLLWPTYQPRLAAGAAFHGFPTNDTANPNTPTEPAGRAAELRVPVIANFGEADKLVPMSEVERYREAMNKAGRDFELHTYAGRDHGWTGKKNPSYDENDAELAWRRSVQFLTRRIAARTQAAAPNA